MPNKRFAKFPSKGASNGKDGPKRDNVGPIKTANWPGPPGKTGHAFKNAQGGFKKVRGSAKQEGV
jgi:hypothetical protein